MTTRERDASDNLTTLIETADAGDPGAADQLFALLYAELHAVAERQIRRGGSGLTLGTTTLLHEAYLDMAAREGIRFPDRKRFLAYASRAMRGLLIDYARRRRAGKRGGEFHITSSDAAEGADVAEAPAAGTLELERVAEGLETLSQADPALAELVDLHFFAGFSLGDIARMRGVSERTVQRDWRKAKLLLFHAMGDGMPTDAAPHG